MANRWFTQFVSTLHKKPAIIDCNFIVDAPNGSGYGARSLKGPGVAKVFMNTSASFTGTVTSASNIITAISGGTASFQVGAQVTGTGIPAGTVITSIPSSSTAQMSAAATATGAAETIAYFAPGSPRPAAGLIYVTFQDNWSYYYYGTSGFGSPLSGTPISISTAASLTIGAAYTITSLGTTTLAQWQAVGVPVGAYSGSIVSGTPVLPTVGTTFVATATAGSGTGQVQVSTNSGIARIEVVGDPNQTINSKGPNILGAPFVGANATGSGAYMVLQCLNSSGSVTAPAAGTTIGLSFFFSNSSIQVRGD